MALPCTEGRSGRGSEASDVIARSHRNLKKGIDKRFWGRYNVEDGSCRNLALDVEASLPIRILEALMKKFIGEFKKFITRGNVVDMAVGVIVGSAFTAIVNSLSNNILKPLINWLLALVLGADSLSEVYTMLKVAYDADGQIDLSKSIYLDWGALINAIINFFLIAIVLFIIVKLINRMRQEQNDMFKSLKEAHPSRAERKEMKKLGIKFSNKAAVAEFYANKAKKAEEEKLAAAEKARLDRLANPTTEDLLKEIRDLLEKEA